MAIDKKVVVHKGSLLVSAYIKEQDQLAADGPQDIAASILRGFDHAKRRQHEELVSTRRMAARPVSKTLPPGQSPPGWCSLGARAALLVLSPSRRGRTNLAAL